MNELKVWLLTVKHETGFVSFVTNWLNIGCYSGINIGNYGLFGFDLGNVSK